ncbi:MAG: hypothetical protein L0177_08415, partial [Chloroflexi bacterium]|nr:hypothetical protein [Chloroflexota bacterium]
MTSARVGTGDFTIDSSICVAVITGLPAALDFVMRSFWILGMRASGNPVPGAVVTLTEHAFPGRKFVHNADGEGPDAEGVVAAYLKAHPQFFVEHPA